MSLKALSEPYNNRFFLVLEHRITHLRKDELYKIYSDSDS